MEKRGIITTKVITDPPGKTSDYQSVTSPNGSYVSSTIDHKRDGIKRLRCPPFLRHETRCKRLCLRKVGVLSTERRDTCQNRSSESSATPTLSTFHITPRQCLRVPKVDPNVVGSSTVLKTRFRLESKAWSSIFREIWFGVFTPTPFDFLTVSFRRTGEERDYGRCRLGQDRFQPHLLIVKERSLPGRSSKWVVISKSKS